MKKNINIFKKKSTIRKIIIIKNYNYSYLIINKNNN